MFVLQRSSGDPMLRGITAGSWKDVKQKNWMSMSEDLRMGNSTKLEDKQPAVLHALFLYHLKKQLKEAETMY